MRLLNGDEAADELNHGEVVSRETLPSDEQSTESIVPAVGAFDYPLCGVACPTVPALQGLARATVRSGRDDPKLPEWLATIALQGESESWKAWAGAQSLARMR